MSSLSSSSHFTCNSSTVESGSVFIAQTGSNFDGHAYVADAFARGASYAVVERVEALNGKPGILVPSARIAWSAIAGFLYHAPSRELFVAGVTGTNGKTTVQSMLAQALALRGAQVARIGTLGLFIAEDFCGESLTTPDAFDIQQFLATARDKGADSVVMETSSHGLQQQRVAHIEFNVAIFTNMTRDHLDYHETFEEYYAAKKILFEQLCSSPKEQKGAVLNVDDVAGSNLADFCESMGATTVRYGQSEQTNIRIVHTSLQSDGTKVCLAFDGEEHTFHTSSIGKFSVYNLAAVAGALFVVGVPADEIVALLAALKPAPGRLELIEGAVCPVYVDYAHTPDALKNVLETVREVCVGDVWVICGCGGDRDKGKRPEMAAIAGELADQVVLTSDNPRTEDPQAIIDDMLAAGITPRLTEVDRRKAIQFTLQNALPEDVILIAGKGHEDYQIIGTEKRHFSDQEEVRNFVDKVQADSP